MPIFDNTESAGDVCSTIDRSAIMNMTTSPRFPAPPGVPWRERWEFGLGLHPGKSIHSCSTGPVVPGGIVSSRVEERLEVEAQMAAPVEEQPAIFGRPRSRRVFAGVETRTTE